MSEPQKTIRVVFWGTYDLGKPRIRLLLAGAKAVGLDVVECHANVWEGVEDKSRLNAWRVRWRRLVSWISHYPSLIWRYMQLPPHDVVLIGYMGQLDVLILWPFARWRRVPIVWDAFLSLYDTIVNDRHMVSQYSPMAWALFAWEWLACRAADTVFLDTDAHARYFEELFRLPGGTVGRIQLGAETHIFAVSSVRPHHITKSPDFTVLFYGQFAPLHGIDTIVEAAHRVEQSGEAVRWILIGRGQEEKRIDMLIQQLGVKNIERIQWVPYEQLVDWMREADVCLGIFGTSGKAARVIPNKVYQILAARRPLITADTPAIQELFCEGLWMHLVPPGSAESLAAAVLKMKTERHRLSTNSPGNQGTVVIGPTEVGEQLHKLLLRSVWIRDGSDTGR